MTRALKVPKRYADVVEALAATKEGGWSYWAEHPPAPVSRDGLA